MKPEENNFSELADNEAQRQWATAINAAIAAWSAKLYAKAKQLYAKATALSIELRKRGFRIGGVSNNDVVYVTRAVEMIVENPDSVDMEYLTREVKDVLERTIPEKRFTIVGYVVYEINADSTLSLAEENEEEKVELPEHPQTRSLDIIRENNKAKYPPICSSVCDYSRVCPYFPKNKCQVCVNRHDLQTNDKVFQHAN
jgi:hypothetical protein